MLALSLVACGGGGGGGGGSTGGGSGSSPPPSPPPPPPPPPSGTLALDQSNALPAARFAFSGIEQANTSGDLLFFAAASLFESGQQVLQFECQADPDDLSVLVTVSHVDSDGDFEINAGDGIRIEHGPCGGVERDITISLTMFDGSAASFRGHVTFTANAFDGVSVEGSFDMNSRFVVSIPMVQNRQDFTSIQARLTTDGSSAVELLIDGQSTVLYDSSYRLWFSGEIDSETLGGSILFETPELFVAPIGSLPDFGELLILGLDSTARIGISADDYEQEFYFDYALDIGNTGQFPAAQQGWWKDIIVGSIFGWDRNSPPRVTSISIAPENPKATDDLTVSYTSSDPDGDPLEVSIRWSANFQTLATDTETLVAGQHEKGDVVGVSIEVFDGRDADREFTNTTIVNSAPTTSASLTPEMPRTTDQITAHHGGADVDPDQLTYTYDWLRNGQTIAGANERILFGDETRKGDTITVVVTASDGEATGSSEASAVIVDTPPVLSLGSNLHAANHGETTSIEVIATDADNEPVSGFVLTHGPSGMTIDSETGVVSWTPNRVMFGNEEQIRWGATLDQPGINQVSGSVYVTDGDRQVPIFRSGLGAPGESAMQVGDFDGDGNDELMLITEALLYELEWSGTDFAWAWAYPPYFDEDRPLTVVHAADIDSDGFDEVFAGYGGTIAVIDGASRELLRSRGVGAFNHEWRDIRVADLNNDGLAQLIALATWEGSSDPAADSFLGAFRTDGLARDGVTFPRDDYGSSMALGNVDADPALEIVTGGGYVFDGADWTVQWQAEFDFGWDVETGDIDGDGIEEIIATDGGSNVVIYDAQSQSTLWTVPVGPAGTLLAEDLTGDGRVEIIVGDAAGGSGEVRVYEYDGDADEFGLILQEGTGSGGVAAIGIGDVDQDGETDIVWSTDDAMPAFVLAEGDPLTIQWDITVNPLFSMSGPYIGGQLLEAGPGGEPAAVFATATDDGLLRMTATDIGSGDLTISGALATTSSDKVALVLADYDLDGTDESLLVSTDDADLTMQAYDFVGESAEWVTTLFSANKGVAAAARGDLTGDGRPDLVTVDVDGKVRAHDPFGDAVIFEGPVLGGGRDVELVDQNGIGLPEILVAAADRLHVYSADGGGGFELVLQSAQSYPGLNDMVTGDIDGDGEIDVFVLNGTQAVIHRLDTNLAPVTSFETFRTVETFEIAASPYSRKNILLAQTGGEPLVIEIDPGDGEEIWRSPILLGEIVNDGIRQFHDPVTGDARMSIATSGGTYVTQ